MMNTLNGWQRLWVLLSALYLIPILVFSAYTFPNPTGIAHEDTFYDLLAPELRAKLFIDEKNRISNDQFNVEMPNGHILRYKSGLKKTEMERVAAEYYELLENRANKERVKHVLLALTWWIVPSIFLYVFGWTVGWVYKGFKRSPRH